MAGLVMALGLGGCGRHVIEPPRPVDGGPAVRETGVASWYGPGFHGRKTSNGERYDQYAMTAAHRTLPLGTRVQVTNLDNGRVCRVRINDRGPFVKGRIIDLSYGAARSIDMIGPGTAPVRVDVLEAPPGQPLYVLYTVQVAAFDERGKAEALESNLKDQYDEVYIHPGDRDDRPVYRVRVGPYRAREDAERRAVDLTHIGLPAMVTEEPGR